MHILKSDCKKCGNERDALRRDPKAELKALHATQEDTNRKSKHKGKSDLLKV